MPVVSVVAGPVVAVVSVVAGPVVAGPVVTAVVTVVAGPVVGPAVVVPVVVVPLFPPLPRNTGCESSRLQATSDALAATPRTAQKLIRA
jgi:hypothetical protein